MQIIPLAFYQRDAATVARELLGKVLVRASGGVVRRARIVETEAYEGAHDLACHSARGRTPRTEVMFQEGGRAYIYFVYGMHHMLNFVTGHEGDAQAVLIRAAEPLDGWEADLSGPGKLARALGLTRKDNGAALDGRGLHVVDGRAPQHVMTSPRVGVDYAGERWRDAPLRFYDADSRCVSRVPSRRASRR